MRVSSNRGIDTQSSFWDHIRPQGSALQTARRRARTPRCEGEFYAAWLLDQAISLEAVCFG